MLIAPEHLVQHVQTETTLDYDAYIDQILARWIKAERLQGLPTQVQHRRIVLAWLVEKFAPDRRYDPRQVDDVLAYWCNGRDPHTLDLTAVSRALIDAQLLARTRDGRWYWRTASALVQATDAFSPDLLPVADTAAIHVPFTVSPLLVLVRIALRIKAGQAYPALEMDGLIQRDQKDVAGDPATLRATLVTEGLLQQQANDTYIRPTLIPDHPALVKLREEALARQRGGKNKLGVTQRRSFMPLRLGVYGVTVVIYELPCPPYRLNWSDGVRTTFEGLHRTVKMVLLCNPPKWDAPGLMRFLVNDNFPLPRVHLSLVRWRQTTNEPTARLELG